MFRDHRDLHGLTTSFPTRRSSHLASSEGSDHIIRMAHESDEPLWVLTWGSMTDVAQALHDDPSIVGKIKLISIGGWNTRQDQSARDYVYENFEKIGRAHV